MKIIKHGNKKNRDTTIGQITCPNCKTIFKFEKWESRELTFWVYKIECPDCKKTIAFSETVFK